jgi:hypothetical protein
MPISFHINLFFNKSFFKIIQFLCQKKEGWGNVNKRGFFEETLRRKCSILIFHTYFKSIKQLNLVFQACLYFL